MSETLVAPNYTLTADDLKLIADVCEETAKDGSPIALVRGPETQALLRKWFPKNDGWAKLQKLGTLKRSGGPAMTPGSRPSNQFQKRVERIFVGSKRWPEGLPVGMTDAYAQKELGMDAYILDTSSMDVMWGEYERLRFMSVGRKKLTDHQLREDADRKDAIRANRAEIEATTTPEQRAAAAAMEQTKVLVKELVKELKGGTK